MIFNGDYQFKGSHAEKANRLVTTFNGNNSLFNRLLDVYLLAPIVGFLYNRSSPIDNNGKPVNILFDAMSKEQNKLWLNYRLIMLLDKQYEADFDKRVDKAFRNYGKESSQPDEEKYEEYVRGGVDVLYEKLIEPSNTEEDFLKNLFDFIDEFENRYGQSTDEILDLTKLARI